MMRPTTIVVHLHKSLADTRFVTHLESRLRERLQPAVEVLQSDFDYQPAARWEVLDGRRVIEQVGASIHWPSAERKVHVFVLPDDMRLPPARFNFAVSLGTPETPFHIVVISLARLQSFPWFGDRLDRNPRLTAERVLKMLMKNVAKVSGFTGSTLCVFGFPRSVGELDAMPAGYCQPDLTTLVAAGIARAPGPGD